MAEIANTSNFKFIQNVKYAHMKLFTHLYDTKEYIFDILIKMFMPYHGLKDLPKNDVKFTYIWAPWYIKVRTKHNYWTLVVVETHVETKYVSIYLTINTTIK